MEMTEMIAVPLGTEGVAILREKIYTPYTSQLGRFNKTPQTGQFTRQKLTSNSSGAGGPRPGVGMRLW